MNPEAVIARNFAWCAEHDDCSFSGRLHEEGLWDRGEYWLLERALYELAKADTSQELTWRVFRIFSYCFMVIGCHFDRNDGFKITNIKRRELYELRERFQLVFEGFFSKDMPDQKSFTEQNPLLVGRA